MDPTHSDAALVRQVLGGDTEAFGALIRRHLDAVQGVAFAWTGNHADAEDVAQDTFLQAYEGLASLRDGGKVRAWLIGIARNLSRGVLRKRGRTIEPVSEAATVPDPARNELHDLLRQRLARLSEADREVLALHYFAGQSTAELANALGISRHAAKKRLERARARLGAELAGDVGEALAPESKKPERCAAVLAFVLDRRTVMWPEAAATGSWWPVPNGVGSALGIAAVIAVAAVWIAPNPKPIANDGSNVPEASDGTTASAPSVQETSSENSVPIAAASRAIAESAQVAGLVIDEHGDAVPGLTVLLFNYVEPQEATSDNEGRFRFSDLPAGLYRMALASGRHGGYVLAGDAPSFTIPENSAPVQTTLKVMPEAIVEGRVTYDGAPIAGQLVAFYYAEPYRPERFSMSEEPGFGTYVDGFQGMRQMERGDKDTWRGAVAGDHARVRTDGNGRFRLDGVVASAHGLVPYVSLEVHYESTRDPQTRTIIESLAVRPGETTRAAIDVALEAGEIHAELDHGDMVADRIQVSIARVEAKPERWETVEYLKAIDGEPMISLTGVPVGPVAVRVRLGGDAASALRAQYAVVQPGRPASLHFDYTRGPAIVGTVGPLDKNETAVVYILPGMHEGPMEDVADEARHNVVEVLPEADGSFLVSLDALDLSDPYPMVTLWAVTYADGDRTQPLRVGYNRYRCEGNSDILAGLTLLRSAGS